MLAKFLYVLPLLTFAIPNLVYGFLSYEDKFRIQKHKKIRNQDFFYNVKYRNSIV